MRLAIIESPYSAPTTAGIKANLDYCRAAMRFCLVELGVAPFASHALYTQEGVLNDSDPKERALGVGAGGGKG